MDKPTDQSTPPNAKNDSGTNAAPNTMPSDATKKLLLKFAVIWGKTWGDQIAGIPYRSLEETWAEGLAGLTGDQLKTGLEHVTKTCKWPPSIAEFRAACLPPPDGRTAEQRAYDARAEADKAGLLERSTWAQRKAVGLRHLGAMKDALSAKQPATPTVPRTDRNIDNGTWTPAMEERFTAACAHLGVPVTYPKTPAWVNHILNPVAGPPDDPPRPHSPPPPLTKADFEDVT